MDAAHRMFAAALLALTALLLPDTALGSGATGGVSAAAAPVAGAAVAPDPPPGEWRWPVDGPRTVREPYQAPAHAYGSGHRGVDIAVEVGAEVHAPAAGVVAFRGVVVDRPLLTVDHGGGLVTTFEPVESDLAPGTSLEAGDLIGVVGVGGHTAPGSLHIGLRVHGEYVDPSGLFGAAERAVLLPCCA